MIFLICGQLMWHPLTQLSHPSDLLQMPNDSRMGNVELLGNFLCGCKRISFDDPLTWPATVLFIFKTLLFFAKLLEPPLHCTFFFFFF